MAIKDSIAVKSEELSAAIKDAQTLIDDVNSDPEQAKAAMDLVTKLQEDIDALKKLADSEDDDSNDDDHDDDDTANDDKKKEGRDMPIKINSKNKVNERSILNEIIHSKGEKRDSIDGVSGIKSTDVGVTIPESIIYNPENKLETVVDLSELVTKEKVTSRSGKYPMLKRADSKMYTVKELEESPELAKPEFLDVNYEVDTYRGKIPISQEAIDDSAVDLTSLVGQHSQTLKVNTGNAKITETLKQFTGVEVKKESLVDGLKEIYNVKIDPAYQKTILLTASMFQLLDTTKDEEGRYLLQNEISSESGKALSSIPLVVVKDEAFGGEKGSQQAFVGDLKRAILFANREDLQLEWVQYPIYGRILEPVVRFDVVKADPDAGYFVTLAAATSKKQTD
ncbi:phage major capsid protein [Weissella tructae]|uniref:phage major capsid protein n=1 Tax=Weissella tructae TaxID=887702 RepID=UPI003D89F5A4